MEKIKEIRKICRAGKRKQASKRGEKGRRWSKFKYRKTRRMGERSQKLRIKMDTNNGHKWAPKEVNMFMQNNKKRKKGIRKEKVKIVVRRAD